MEKKRYSYPEKAAAYFQANKERTAAHRKMMAALYYERNKEKIAERKRLHYLENREKLVECSAQWKKDNPEKHIAQYTNYAKQYPQKIAEKVARRMAAKLKATVVWVDEFIVSEMYDLAALRTAATGIKWHVDHIVPLQSKIVCGLHCEANLRVVPAKVNLRKSNSNWPDMP